jgi:preprotein translocase subunit SecG
MIENQYFLQRAKVGDSILSKFLTFIDTFFLTINIYINNLNNKNMIVSTTIRNLTKSIQQEYYQIMKHWLLL